MEQIIDFEKKQDLLMACINMFQRLGPTDNTSRRQWFDSVAHYVKEGGFDNGATSYKIDYYHLKNEVALYGDKMDGIYRSIDHAMRFFHQFDQKAELETDPFITSLATDCLISQDDLNWLAGVYDGVVYRFRANAILMEQFLNDASKGDYDRKYVDEDIVSRRLFHIEPYESDLRAIKKEYTTPQEGLHTSTPRAKKGNQKKEWHLSEEHKKKLHHILHNKTSTIVTKSLLKVFSYMENNEIEIPSFGKFDSVFPSVIERSQYYKAKAQYEGQKPSHINSKKLFN